jgi:hypothetical protein
MLKLHFTGHGVATDACDHHEASAAVTRRLQIPYEVFAYPEFRHALTRAELRGELSELCALGLHAVLAIADGSPFVDDYLAMARSLASPGFEASLLARIARVHRLACEGAAAAADHCLVLVAQLCQTPTLWRALSLALLAIGDQGAIDVVLAAPLTDRRVAGCGHVNGGGREAACPEQLGFPRPGHDLDESALS